MKWSFVPHIRPRSRRDFRKVGRSGRIEPAAPSSRTPVYTVCLNAEQSDVDAKGFFRRLEKGFTVRASEGAPVRWDGPKHGGRLYWSKAEELEGEWTTPPLNRVQ